MTNRDFDILVFDWDGTLVDSEAQIVASIQAAITEVGLEPRDAHAIKDIIGLGLNEALETLYPQEGQAARDALRAHYARHFYSRTQEQGPVLFDGARRMLETVHSAGYGLAVATGKGRRGLDHALAATGLKGFFDLTRCADETRSKPDPAMLHSIMEGMGGIPGRTLMVGDTEYDMAMASAARVAALAVGYGVHEPARLLKYNPLGCLSQIGELPSWLEGRPVPAHGDGAPSVLAGG